MPFYSLIAIPDCCW